MDEFRLTVKKLELLSFNMADRVEWITREETYFEVHRIYEDVGIQLAH